MDHNSLWIWSASILDLYKEDVDAYVGLFNLVGTALTPIAVIFTAIAAIAASKSTAVSQRALELAEKNSKRDDFNRHFTLLLEQHNLQLDIVKGFLDSEEGKKFYESLRNNITLKEANALMHGHSIISPYMRVLYHLLKHIKNFQASTNSPFTKKNEYSSLVRSLIRNDVLYLVALNSCYTGKIDGEEGQYNQYQSMLHLFFFFEHAKFYKEISNENANAKETIKRLKVKNDSNIYNTYDSILEDNFLESDPLVIPLYLIVASTYINPDFTVSANYLQQLHNQLSTDYSDRYNDILQTAKKEAEISSFFSLFIGWYAIPTTETLREDIYFKKAFSLNELAEHPFVDIQFIKDNLVKYEQETYETPSNLYFCSLRESGSIVHQLPGSFDRTCRLYLNKLKYIDKLESNFFYDEVGIYMEFWQSYIKEIQSMSVSSQVRSASSK